jgi:glycosyltransferase involved in cell wall biosynthesis
MIGNGINNLFFQEAAAEARLQAGELRKLLHLPKKFFLYVGALSPEKNLRRTLQAYRVYSEKIDREAWDFVIAGAGAEESRLRQTLDARTLESVKFLGFHPWEELGTIYGLASCFILPSLSETWGLVVNEAMAAGLPVLVSERCGCVPELVEEGRNGYTFDPYDVAQLADLMGRLSQDEGKCLEMGVASRQIVRKMDHNTWASGLLSLIEECRAKK